jgi:hypothetical protein
MLAAQFQKSEKRNVKLARTELMSLSTSTLQKCLKASLISVNLSSDWTNSKMNLNKDTVNQQALSTSDNVKPCF